MSVYEYTGNEALDWLQRNPASVWYEEKGAGDRDGGWLAAKRLGLPVFRPWVQPRFRVRKVDHVFAIGSCFARGIEMALTSRGFTVDSLTSAFDQERLRRTDVRARGTMNKYNIPAMRQEIEWALVPDKEWPADCLVPLGDGTWFDTQSAPFLEFAHFEKAVERRRRVQQVVRELTHCRVVILTLGMAEAWKDKRSGLVMNSSPLAEMVRREPDRYAFHVLDYSENWESLETIHRILSAYGHPEYQIVVTVSPQPLFATFSPQDIVVANAFSKAMLRTLAGTWEARHDNVHYFPSYEIVMNSAPALVWQADRRHVTGELAHAIVDCFVRNYVVEER